MADKEFNHYELGSKENKFIDGALKWFIETSIMRGTWFLKDIKDFEAQELRNPFIRDFYNFWVSELEKYEIIDKRHGEMAHRLLKLVVYILNRDGYYRQRSVVSLRRFQKYFNFEKSKPLTFLKGDLAEQYKKEL